MTDLEYTVQEYQRGASVAELAESTGLTRQTIYTRLAKAGIVFGESTKGVELVYAALAATGGIGAHTLAEQLGLHYSTIGRHLGVLREADRVEALATPDGYLWRTKE